jgi:hypothetical protein
VEWQAAVADAAVETHDRIVGKTWNDAKARCDARIADAKKLLHGTLRAFSGLGAALLEARGDGAPLDGAVAAACGWQALEGLVATAAQLTDTMAADALAHVVHGYHRFRRYAPRMLRMLDLQAAPVAEPLIAAAQIVIGGGEQVAEQTTTRSTTFLRRGSKWHRHLQTQDPSDHRLWEVAVLFHLREAFRSGDIWLTHSRRYADLKNALVPIAAVQMTPRLVVPFDPADWLADCKARMAEALERLAAAAKAGAIPGGSIEDGSLKLERLSAAVPAEAEDLALDLYKRLPDIRITDLLLEVDDATGFTEAFTHIRTGAPCTDKIGLARMSCWPKA